MRRLSDPEFAQFMTDNAASIAGLGPGQSKIIDWGSNSYGNWSSMSVLVFIGANPIQNDDGTISPDVHLADVTGATQFAAVAGPGYGTTPPQTMLDTLPQAIKDTIVEDAAAAGALVDQAGNALSAAAKAAADDAKNAASAILTPLLIGVAIVFGLMYFPRGRH